MAQGNTAVSALPLIVFTDLDGTLLDHDNYSFALAKPALNRLRAMRVPLILTSSKTLAELADIRTALDLDWPVIAENGGAVGFPLDGWKPDGLEQRWGLMVRGFGPDRARILQILERLSTDFSFTGFGSMTVKEIAERTGLDIRAARAAAQRNFTEPLTWTDDLSRLTGFSDRLARHNLRCVSGGRFVHVMGLFDKVTAMDWLLSVLPGVTTATRTIALGDSDNDVQMLERADVAVMVKSPVRDYPLLNTDTAVIRTTQCGPAGWNDAVLGLLGTTS